MARFTTVVAIAIAIAIAIGLASAGPAIAEERQSEAARSAEATARDAFRKERYEEAAESFAAAFRLDPKANTKYNEAFAWHKAERFPAAADAYEEALAYGGLSDDLRERASEALGDLKIELGRLVVQEPLGAEITVEHARARGVPARIHLPPGKHEVSVRHIDGRSESRVITIVAGSDTRVTFVAETPPPLPDAPAPETPEGDGTAFRVVGWTSLGLGAGALIAMGALGGLTLSAVSRYDDTGNTDVELYDEAVRLKTATNALLGVGAGLAAIGAVFLIIASVESDTAFQPTADGVAIRF
jgi:tetratricopeptide (TPR) repeat protein